jgi:hypothetical protein
MPGDCRAFLGGYGTLSCSTGDLVPVFLPLLK